MSDKRSKAGKQLKAPNLPRRGFEQGSPISALRDQDHFAQRMLSQADLSSSTASHVTFDQLICQQLRLSNARLKRGQVLDSRFGACDLANAAWNEATFCRVELLDCQLTGFALIEALVQDVLFKDCQCSFAQFRFAKFRTARFEHCDLHEADFQSANLKDVIFVDCDLRGVELSGATLSNVDLRGSMIDGMRAGPHELKGAIIEPRQALAFVRGMGIEVRLSHEE